MSFVNERAVKAVRKPHQCVACATAIDIGEPAVRWSGMTDGYFSSVIYHSDCRAAEIAFNDLHGTFSDEWQGLLYDREPDDNDWLIENWPTVAARLGLASVDTHPKGGDALAAPFMSGAVREAETPK